MMDVKYRRLRQAKCSRKRQVTAYFRHETERKRYQYGSSLFGGNSMKRHRFRSGETTYANLG